MKLLLFLLIFMLASGAKMGSTDNSSFKYINHYLNDNPKIITVDWSPNKKNVAFIEGDMSKDEALGYIWRVGEKEPVKLAIEEASLVPNSGFEWSPNDEYLLVDVGTSIMRSGYFIPVKNVNLMINIGYLHGVNFSPNSQWVVFNNLSGVKAVGKENIEIDESLTLYILSTESLTIQIVGKGDNHTDYYMKSWENNSLIYTKRDLLSETDEVKSYKPGF